MKPLFLAALMVLAGVAQAPETLAQQTKPTPPAAPHAPPPQENISIHELPSNQQSNVDVDHFLGYPIGFTKIWNGLMIRSMLHHGDPYTPGPTGAVLEYRDDLSLATLQPHYESGGIASDEITIYYVQGGAGHVDTGPGTKTYDLHDGVGVLFAPGVKQHFVNTGDTPLSMIMLSWRENDGLQVKQDIKVMDGDAIPLSSDRAHWVHSPKPMFNPSDGINMRMTPILIPPMSYAGPHAHAHGVEEIWVKTGADAGYAILGSEVRKINGVAAFLAPPNGVTVHSALNINEDRPQIWIYMARALNSPGQRPAQAQSQQNAAK